MVGYRVRGIVRVSVFLKKTAQARSLKPFEYAKAVPGLFESVGFPAGSE